MINVVSQQHTTAPRRIVGRRPLSSFWVMLGIEALVIAAVLVLVLSTLAPAPVPPVSAEEREIVRAAILNRIQGYEPDPLFEVLPGVSAPVSNVAGFTLRGQVYYYYVEGQTNYDPLSRGKLSQSQVEVVLRDTSSPNAFVVYQQMR